MKNNVNLYVMSKEVVIIFFKDSNRCIDYK